MVKILNNIFNILVINGAILIIPGVNFLLIAKHSLLNGFSSGFRCTIGVTLAIMLHVILAAFSVSLLLKDYPVLFEIIRYGGAAYLVYLGTRFLIVTFKENAITDFRIHALDKHNSDAFYAGFLVDLLNPFVSIFYLSLFPTLMVDNESVFELIYYGLTIFIITLGWFSFVALLFSQADVRNYFQGKNRYIQFLSGMAMYYFSSKVIFNF